VPQLYYSPYSLKYLKSFVDEINSSKKIKDAFVYFNNDVGGNAVKNAKEMIAIVDKEKRS
jgi:uncharacterized protein YecE (DUF72 family)